MKLVCRRSQQRARGRSSSDRDVDTARSSLNSLHCYHEREQLVTGSIQTDGATPSCWAAFSLLRREQSHSGDLEGLTCPVHIFWTNSFSRTVCCETTKNWNPFLPNTRCPSPIWVLLWSSDKEKYILLMGATLHFGFEAARWVMRTSFKLRECFTSIPSNRHFCSTVNSCTPVLCCTYPDHLTTTHSLNATCKSSDMRQRFFLLLV